MRKLFMTTTAAAIALAGAAQAQTMATAGTDLNVRSGPGVQNEVIGSIKSGAEVTVSGCIESANWCEVVAGDLSGWSYGDYLTVKAGDKIEPLYPNRQQIGVTVIEAPAADKAGAGQNAAVGGVTGAAMGALVAGPIGAVAGAALGGTSGAAATEEPDAQVTTYVTQNTVDPVYLEGEVVPGAGIPEDVTLYDIPEYPAYRYAQINGQTVLVNPNDRQIVYIYR
ncbi:MAG: DUF1236 domain-containing protein [Paracoccus sp. (in: a-proteobacteria)]|mgnify:FL=1|uniref:DUF1236 domain-containing protein n=1 Tax=unclassified Paracoccus (in: a-proteobacteria) TaxID=2688777 RepID=UPI000C430B41|nr:MULTISPECIES: DUF1236 domain-containing protein [unclassified Paracoccus (in: a-proteobacteria)]MBA50480.1 hypothetical protein [Paracoccus sp. (in: a-proteobacteria)]|tara:strand:+ start:424 stop:1095 length:672 start_codon:yes stop_codon:yes gene_type:complete